MLLEDLKIFVLVVETKSFSSAAVRMRIAQSSLSKRVQRLEQHFGTLLLNRHGRGVNLTGPGAVLYERAAKLIADTEALELEVHGSIAEPVGLVRLAMPPASGPVIAPMVFETCRLKYPKIQIQLVEGTSGTIHQWLSDGEVDLALIYNPELSPDFEVRPLVAEPLYLIGPALDRETGAPLAYPQSYSMNDLSHLPLIMPRYPNSIRVLLERICAGNGIQPNVICESDSNQATKGIVELGLGHTIFSRTYLSRELLAGTLKAVPFSSALLSWKLCMAYSRRENVSLAVRTVQRIVEDKVAKLFAEGFWAEGRLLNAAS